MRHFPLVSMALTVMVVGGCTPIGVATPTPPASPGTGSATVIPSAALDLDLMYPDDVAVDQTGNLYVSDTWGMRVDRIAPNGQVTTVVKTNYGDWRDDAKALDLPIGQISSLAVAGDGTLMLASGTSNRLVRISPNGSVSSTDVGRSTSDIAVMDNGDPVLLAHDGLSTLRLPRSGPAVVTDLTKAAVRRGSDTLPAVTSIAAVTVDPQRGLLLSEPGQHRILRLATDGHLELVAGTGAAGFAGDGGPATQAALNRPGSMAVDATTGNVVVADTDNRRIRRITPDGLITTVAGTDLAPTLYPDNGDNGPATQARLVNLQGMAVDRSGNLYLSDSYLKQIRKVDRLGVISRLAGKMPSAATQIPYGTDTLSLSQADRLAARALADAVRAFDDRLSENAAWMTKLHGGPGLEALIQSGSGVGIFDQKRGSTAESDGGTTQTLTTRRVDKVVEVIETVSRTDLNGSLQRAALKRITSIRGISGGREQLIVDQSLRSGRFGASGTMTLTHTDAQGDPDWQLTATTGPGPTDAPGGSGAITCRVGSLSRRFSLTWDSQAKPQLTVREEAGTLRLTTSPGDDDRMMTATFQSGDRAAGEIRLR